MSENKFLALLRGINVGGNNIIKMESLRLSFEQMGFSDVTTYIQSGNVIFKSTRTNKEEVTDLIEKELSTSFVYESKIVLVSFEQLKTVIRKAPDKFGNDPEKYRYDVLFLKSPLTSDEAFKSLKTREGVDYVTPGDDVLYFSRLIEKAGQSYMSKIITTPIYKNMTIRNWNTTKKLYELMT